MDARLGWPTRGDVRRLAMVATCLVALTGCGKDETPSSPPPIDALGFEALDPAPRSRFVPTDVSRISARATDDLDSLTVNERTVFLKIDTQRVGIRVRLAADGRTIEIAPLEGLVRNQHYTVELSTSIATRDGRSLARPVLWQFQTSGLLRPVLVYPAPGSNLRLAARDRVEWTGNVTAGSGAVYVLRWSTDYTTVQNGGGDVQYVGTSNVFLPVDELPTESVFCAVDAVTPGAPPLSSAILELRSERHGDPTEVDPPLSRRSTVFESGNPRPRCDNELQAGPGTYSVVEFSYASTSVDVRSASIVVQLQGTGTLPDDLLLTIHPLAADWTCSPVGVFNLPVIQTSLGVLAQGEPAGTRRYVFRNGALASHIHWMLRSNRRLEYAIRSNYMISMSTPTTDGGPFLELTVSPRQ